MVRRTEGEKPGAAPGYTEVRVYVEGGGNTDREQEPLRRGFRSLFEKVLATHAKPKVIACGPRSKAMEAWLVADPEALEAHYGQGFRKEALPARKEVEGIPKKELYEAIARATKDTKTKGRYDKAHGFALIGKIDPTKVRPVAPHAARFFDHLTASCAALPRARR